VGKKSKHQSTNGEHAAEAVASASFVADSATVQPTKKRTPAKAPAKKITAKKKTVGAGAKRPARRRPTPAVYEPSDADIRLRAYFIAERRVQLALQGDPGRDWIAAKQELLKEAGQAAS